MSKERTWAASVAEYHFRNSTSTPGRSRVWSATILSLWPARAEVISRRLARFPAEPSHPSVRPVELQEFLGAQWPRSTEVGMVWTFRAPYSWANDSEPTWLTTASA